MCSRLHGGLPMALLAAMLVTYPPTAAATAQQVGTGLPTDAIGQPGSEVVLHQFDDQASAEAFSADLAKKGIRTTVTRQRAGIPLKTLSIGIYADRPEAEKQVSILQRHHIDAWVYPMPEGGFRVHAGAMEEQRHALERREQLQSLGYKDVVIGEKIVYQDVFLVTRPVEPTVLAAVAREKRFYFDGGLVQGTTSAWQENGRTGTGRNLTATLHGRWSPQAHWNIHFGLRADAQQQTGPTAFDRIQLDYEPTYLQYHRGDDHWTVGAQKIVWGETGDGLPDRMAVWDLSRYRLEQNSALQRRAVAALRWQHKAAKFDLDTIWLPLFRAAVLPDADSIWSPVDQKRGRILGLRPTDTLTTLIKDGRFADQATATMGSVGVRLSRRRNGRGRYVTLQYARPSAPYYELSHALRTHLAQGMGAAEALAAEPGTTFNTIHPAGWILGLREETRQWRFEMAVLTAVPVTTTDYRVTTANAVEWLAGSRFRVKDDPRTHVDIHLYGRRLGAAEAVLDRDNTLSVSTAVARSVAGTPFSYGFDLTLGIDQLEAYVNPHAAYTDPRFSVTLAGHFFAGAAVTDAGYHGQHSTIMADCQFSL